MLKNKTTTVCLKSDVKWYLQNAKLAMQNIQSFLSAEF